MGLLFGIGGVALFILFLRKRAPQLPTIGAEQFIDQLGARFPGDFENVGEGAELLGERILEPEFFDLLSAKEQAAALEEFRGNPSVSELDGFDFANEANLLAGGDVIPRSEFTSDVAIEQQLVRNGSLDPEGIER